jgi:hypothetical protein
LAYSPKIINLGKSKKNDISHKQQSHPLPPPSQAIDGRVFFVLDMILIIPKWKTKKPRQMPGLFF